MRVIGANTMNAARPPTVSPLSRLSVVSVLSLLAACALGACAPEANCLDDKSCADSRSAGGAAGDDGGATAANTAAAAANGPVCTVLGKPHIGLGGVDVASSTDGPASGDRARTKPYSALVTEYARVLGGENAPALIGSTGPTFGVAADRWYLEPTASAVFIDTAFEVAFEGCLRKTGEIPGGSAEPKYAVAPMPATARDACTYWTRVFWSHDPTPPQLDACVAAVLDPSSETYGRPGVDEVTHPMTAKRRWAYACASVLTATGFLTY